MQLEKPISFSYFKTKIVVETADHKEGERTFNKIKHTFSEFVVNYDEEPWVDTVSKLQTFEASLQEEESTFSQRFVASLRTIDEALEEFKYALYSLEYIVVYRLDEVAIAFNGGKDCTALLHLLRAQIDK